MPDTQRTSREQAEGYATAWGTRPDGIVQLAMDYLAALDVLERVTAVHLSSDVAHRRELERARAFLASTEGEQP